MTSGTPEAAPVEERVREVCRQLRRVVDPEIGLDVVRLGLVYDVRVVEEEVRVDLTLTSPGCPLSGAITAGAEKVLRGLPWAERVEVRVVWDPPWSPEMISGAGPSSDAPPTSRNRKEC